MAFCPSIAMCTLENLLQFHLITSNSGYAIHSMHRIFHLALRISRRSTDIIYSYDSLISWYPCWCCCMPLLCCCCTDRSNQINVETAARGNDPSCVEREKNQIHRCNARNWFLFFRRFFFECVFFLLLLLRLLLCSFYFLPEHIIPYPVIHFELELRVRVKFK